MRLTDNYQCESQKEKEEKEKQISKKPDKKQRLKKPTKDNVINLMNRLVKMKET